MRRRGFAAVELVMALAVVAILARVTVPALGEWRLRGEAAELVEAVRDLEAAARQARQEQGPSAASGAPVGETPAGLVPFLPAGFAFRNPRFELGWSQWRLGEVTGSRLRGDRVGTITVRIPDPGLRSAFQRLAEPSLWLLAGDSFAFLIP